MFTDSDQKRASQCRQESDELLKIGKCAAFGSGMNPVETERPVNPDEPRLKYYGANVKQMNTERMEKLKNYFNSGFRKALFTDVENRVFFGGMGESFIMGGDSGRLLACQDATGKWRVVGVNYLGFDRVGFPIGVAEKVTRNREWIRGQMKNPGGGDAIVVNPEADFEFNILDANLYCKSAEP